MSYFGKFYALLVPFPELVQVKRAFPRYWAGVWFISGFSFLNWETQSLYLLEENLKLCIMNPESIPHASVSILKK